MSRGSSNAVIEQDFQPFAGEESENAIQPQKPVDAEYQQLHSGNNMPLSVLVIGTEADLFRSGSRAAERAKSYGTHFTELQIICFTRRAQNFAPIKLAEHVHVYPTNSRFALLWGFDAMRIARKLKKTDVITTQDPFECGLLGLFLAWRTRAKLHVQIHTDLTSREFSRHSLRNWLREKMAWFILRRAARVRVILQRTADDIRARGITAPVTVLPIFVDAARFATIPRTKHPRWKIAMLCVGRFEKEKRFEIAIDALAEARGKGHDVGLVLVGEGSERQAYYRYAQRLRVADRLEIVGWHNDLTKYYAEADIVLVPSRYEGYGLVIVEALAAGIPVLATDVGVAGEAGAMVVSAKEFPQAFLRWLENGPRKASLANYPYAILEDYVTKYCRDISKTAGVAHESPL
jgi:glycosyltransferase involved in cell wall biosynthesis